MAQTKLTRIAKYEITDVLGKGGMGVVYKATDPAIGRTVAIKTITSGLCDDADFLRRFYREAQSTGKLQHQNIVIVHELGDQDGTPFLVMEYLEGESLQSIINARRALPLLEKLHYITQACDGLHYAHQRNIVHRDIKPANLMVLRDGVLKIVDFGIARIEDDNVTRTGQVVGTIQYMSPEQINGGTVDCRSDVFSLGVVLYQLLTFSLPFQGRDTGSTLLKIINEPVPDLRQSLSTYPPELDGVLQRALAKSRDERYPTAEDFAFDLSQIQDQLRREMVSQYLQVADDLIARSELTKAKEQVFQVLKIDRQNRRASELLKDVQSLIQNQQRSQQVEQLKSLGEEALAAKQLDRALDCLEQAVALDSRNTSLSQLRDRAREAKENAARVQDAIRRADSAHCAGELDEALAAADEALCHDSTHVEARALRSAIAFEIAARGRQAQVDELLTAAQRNISSRRFTTAIEALRKAEALAPSAPAVKELLSLATSGCEQERKRKEIEQLSVSIQDALSRDDYATACSKAEEALQRFPSDNVLLKLQAAAEKQRRAGEKRRFIEEHVSRARKLLETGSTDQARQVLETASEQYPSETSLLSLLTVVRENLEQQRIETRKQEYIQGAKEALRRKDFKEAIGILEAANTELNHPAEIADLLQFVKDEAAEQARRLALDAAAQEAHRLVSGGDYEDAVSLLEVVLQDIDDEELSILLVDARRQLAEFKRRAGEAVSTGQRLLQSQRYGEAVRFMESQAQACGKSPEFVAALEQARSEQERMQAITAAVDNARRALAANDFDGAALAVDSCRTTVGEHADLKRMAGEIESRRAAAATTAISKAISDCRTLLLGHSYHAALETLQGVGSMVAFVSDDLRERHAMLCADIGRALESERDKLASIGTGVLTVSAADQTQDQGEWKAPIIPKVPRTGSQPAAAASDDGSNTLTALGSLGLISERARSTGKRDATPPAAALTEKPVTTVADGGSSGSAAAVERAASLTQRLSEPSPTIASSPVVAPARPSLAAPPVVEDAKRLSTPVQKGKPVGIIAAAALVLLVAIAAVAGLRHRKNTVAAAAPAPRSVAAVSAEGYLDIVLEPWGKVKSLARSDGSVVTIDEFTPKLVHVPAGEYILTIAGPDGSEHTDKISVTANQRSRYQYTFEVVDAPKIVSSY